jgi:membrane fusion protein, multidrug efflux system
MEPGPTPPTPAPAVPDAEPSPPPRPATPPRRALRRLFVSLALLAVVAVAAYFLYPITRLALTTVSTDDAYVNAHVTYVAPRITETVRIVKVDDNDHVQKGDLLVVLDDTLWKVRVAQAEAALLVAGKNVEQAEAKARAGVAGAKANRFKLASAIAAVKNQVAGLRVAIAQYREAQAAQKLAAAEAARYAELAKRGSITREQADVRQTEAEQAAARVRQALEEVHRVRAALEEPEVPPAGKDLDDVLRDRDQHHSSVTAALSALALSLAEIGLPLPPYWEPPAEFIEAIRSQAPGGDLDKLAETTVAKAPGVQAAQAQVKQAEQVLAQARIELGYCAIRADIDGFVSNRNVNPGDRVTQGQRLLAVRADRDLWIDANFKETQIAPIRIGHPVDIHFDAYPGKVFRGRVSGFNPGTGASTALFPAQNATGNFVKIVQRLPVRIELIGPAPLDTPLFVGLSAEPYVKVYEHPTGPSAGQRLRGNFPRVETQPPPFGIAEPGTASRPSP